MGAQESHRAGAEACASETPAKDVAGNEVRAMPDGLLDLLVSWIVRLKRSATNQLR